MIADIDGVVRTEDVGFALPSGELLGGLGVLECKAVSSEKGWEDDSVPDSYYCQVTHYMTVLGLHWAIIAVLIVNRIEYRLVPLNYAFQTKLLETEERFWKDFVAKGELPAPAGVEGEDDYLDSLYPFPTTLVKPLPGELETLGNRYLEITVQEAEIAAEKERIKAQYKIAIGEAKAGIVGGIEATWSRFTRSSFNRAAFDKDYPGVYARYSEETPSSRFTVKRRKI